MIVFQIFLFETGHSSTQSVMNQNIVGYTGKLSAGIRFKTALRTDERVRFMDEIVHGVQIIKMYAWEKPFARLIAATRRHEIKQVLKNGYVRALFMTVYLSINRLALFFTVLAIIFMNDSASVRVSKIFMVSYLLMGITNSLCRIFVRAIAETGETLVAIKRLQAFLQYEEKDQLIKSTTENGGAHHLNSRNLAILMENVSTGWQLNEGQPAKVKKKGASYKTGTQQNECELNSFKLQELNLEIPKGNLVFIIGPVGAGKSTLMQALLSELPLVCGSMGINGSISYACQENWIFASTVRQNITFGQQMDRTRYDAVIQCTALEKDFEQLSNGDMTVVGENGTGLSGGQKARIK